MLDAKRTFDELIEHLAPDERTRDEVLSNRIYAQLSNAVAGSQEFTAIAKLYDLDASGEFDLLVLDTPPSRNALDFLDAPQAADRLLPGSRDQGVPAPGGDRRADPRPRHRVAARAAATRHGRRPARGPVRVLPRAGRDDRRLRRARGPRQRPARGPGHDVPDRHLAPARPGRGDDLLPPQAARGGDALRRRGGQPAPHCAAAQRRICRTSSSTELGDAAGRPRGDLRARACGARRARRGEHRAPARAARRPAAARRPRAPGRHPRRRGPRPRPRAPVGRAVSGARSPAES